MKEKTRKKIEVVSWIVGMLSVAVAILVFLFGDDITGHGKGETNQQLKNVHTVSGDVSPVHAEVRGNGNVVVNGNTQVISNNTNVQTDDHRAQSPTMNSNVISNSGTLNIGSTVANNSFADVAKVNFGAQSGDNANNQQTGSGKMFNGGGTDSSTTILASNYTINNNYYPQPTNAPSGPDVRNDQTTPPPTDGARTKGVPFPDDFPGFGKSWQITLVANSPKRGGMGAYKEFLVKVNQGDRLRVQAEPVGGASMRIRFEVFTGTGDKSIEYPKKTGVLDWTMTKGIPGDSARVRIYSDVLGQINVTVSKAD